MAEKSYSHSEHTKQPLFSSLRDKVRQLIAPSVGKPNPEYVQQLSHLYTMDKRSLLNHHSYMGIELDPKYSEEHLRPFIEMLPNVQQPMLLDLASGLGDAASYADSLDIKTIRFDITESALQAQKINNPDNQVVLGNAQVLPFRSGDFAGVHMKDAIVHIPNQKMLFSDVARVLRYGGLFLLTTTLREGTSNGYYPVSIESLIKNANRAGLELIDRNKWKPSEAKTDWFGWFLGIRQERHVLLFKKTRARTV